MAKRADSEFDKAKRRFEQSFKENPTQDLDFTTVSGEPLKPLYAPDDIADFDYLRDLGFPGEYPFTRACIRRCTGAASGR